MKKVVMIKEVNATDGKTLWLIEPSNNKWKGVMFGMEEVVIQASELLDKEFTDDNLFELKEKVRITIEKIEEEK